jgi:dihydrolipoamide dehydrogenase
MNEKFDIAVLGGGPGGYVAAIRAAQLGFKTVVIDKSDLGGTCLNWGCIPTKALLKSAEYYDIAKNRGKDFGFSAENVTYDFKKIIKRSRSVSKRVVKGVEYLMRKNKIERIKGYGVFENNAAIKILNEAGEETEKIFFDKAIIATGGKPKTFPDIPVDRKFIITSKEAMSLEEQPESLIIIGAGAIGIEFAYFYNTFGTDVTIIEMLDSLAPLEDTEVSETLKRAFNKRGIKTHLGTRVIKAEVKGNRVEVLIEKDGKNETLVADKVLNAIGVTGNLEGYGLETLGVKTERGFISVDKKTYATNVENIYAVGDVIGAPLLAHVASAEAIHCVETIKGLNPAPVNYDAIPGCTYAVPQMASVGLTESEARERGFDLKIGKFPFSASGKATAIGEREGFVKLIFDAQYGELLGAHIIGAEATELIAELGIAKNLEATYETILKTVHAHPTLSEAIMEAAGDANDEAIHI